MTSHFRRRHRRIVTTTSPRWVWHWRSVAAIVYLFICLCDFVVMPAYREYSYTKMPLTEMLAAARSMPDSASQIETLRLLKADRPWTPITSEIFHLAFGAILGVSALPMNRSINMAANRREEDEEDDEPVVRERRAPTPHPHGEDDDVQPDPVSEDDADSDPRDAGAAPAARAPARRRPRS